MRTLCWDALLVSQSYNPDTWLTYVAQTALMTVRVYALYNRNPIILWVIGTQFALSVIVCLILVCVHVRYLQSGGNVQRALSASVRDIGERDGSGGTAPRTAPSRALHTLQHRKRVRALSSFTASQLILLSAFIRRSCRRGKGQLSSPGNLS